MNEALSLRIASSHNGAYQSGMAMRRILSMRIDVHIRIYPYTFAHIRALSASFRICRMAIPSQHASQLVVVGSAVDSTF